MVDTASALEPVAERGPRTRSPRPSRQLAVAGIAVAAVALLPAFYLVLRAAGRGWTGIADVLTEPGTLGLFLRTTALTAAVTITSIAMAVPLAWLTLRSDLPGRRIWVVVTAMPLVVPSFVGGYAYVAAFGPRGLVQGWLEPLGVDRLPQVYGFGGAWLVLTLFTSPYVLLTVRSALRGLDPALEEASRSLGSTATRTFFRVTLPQLRPAIASGGLLVALYTMSDFGAVSLLRFDSFTRAIYVRYQSSFDRSEAAVLALVLVAMMTVVLAAEVRTRGRAAYHRSHAGAGRRAAPVPLGRWRWVALAGCVVLSVAALAVPVGVTLLWLVRAIRAGEAVGFAVGAAGRSLGASALGAAAAVVCAWPIAMLSARHRGRLSRWTEIASFTGYALPGIVVALALVFFGTRYVPPLYQTITLLVFAYVVLFLPQAVGAERSSLLQVHPSLSDAARSLGRSPLGVLVQVVLPLARPGIATGFALVFLTAMKELPATLLLAPIGYSTLATQVWNATSDAFFGRAAAPALALILLSSLPLAVLVIRESR